MSEDSRPSFANPARTEGFLAEAEKAERACPGDPIILFQAAMAALLDRRPDKAQLYLKRYAKRYVASEPYHLLSALTLAAQKKLIAARALLERHRLTDWRIAMGSFPGGWERRHWLAERLDAIMGRERPTRTRKPAVKPAPVQGRPKSPLSTKSAAPPPAQARPAAQPAIPTLERLQVDIPLVVDSDLRPLLAAATGQAESEGGWFILRERFAHLGLAEGFDELLCVPHLKGIETFWYQTETVQGVKQFRGRVLSPTRSALARPSRRAWCSKSICFAAWLSECWCSFPPRWWDSGGRNWRPNSIFRASPPMTRCFARIPSASGGAADHCFARASPTARACRAPPCAVVRSCDRR